mgnify:CR=1 FL=1
MWLGGFLWPLFVAGPSFRVPFIIGYQRARLAVREHIAVEPPTPPHCLILADTFHN